MGRAEQPSDTLLAVVGPRADCTADEYRAIGAVLRVWLTTHGYARRVYGLEDLETGRMPRSPAAHVVPFQDRFPDERWPVALLAVATGTNLDGAGADLVAELGAVRERLVYLTDPESYDAYTR